MRIKTARYGGWCAECGCRIEEGDEIVYLDFELHCTGCAAEMLGGPLW